MDTEKMITRTEAAARLGVSVRTVDRYIRQGRITAVQYSTAHKPDGSNPVRIREGSVRAYIAACEVTVSDPAGHDGGPAPESDTRI